MFFSKKNIFYQFLIHEDQYESTIDPKNHNDGEACYIKYQLNTCPSQKSKKKDEKKMIEGNIIRLHKLDDIFYAYMIQSPNIHPL